MTESFLKHRSLTGRIGAFSATVLAGGLSTVLGAIFLSPFQSFLVAVAPEDTKFGHLFRQSNPLVVGTERLNVGEVSRFLGNGVTVEASSVDERNGIPMAHIKIQVPNRSTVNGYLSKGKEAIFAYRDVKYALQVVKLMPEDQTVDVRVIEID